MGSFFTEFREMRRFQALVSHQRQIVFYAENSGSWPFFEHIIRNLTQQHGRRICYLTSSPEDPVLTRGDEGILSFYIGDGTIRTILFSILRVQVMVMTMPDLESFHIKRSKHPVHYVFVPHNILSTHMVFRKGAFDHFDTFLCVGPHHKAELREAEEIYGLPKRVLVEHGYARLDTILAGAQDREPARPGPAKQVLIAPSWGPQALFETEGEKLVAALLAADYRVTARPHPDTRRLAGAKLDALYKRFQGHPRFTAEENVAAIESYYRSDVMISDWSGAAFEFAFGLERPVLFIDLPRKVNNPDYGRYQCEPIEMGLRSEVGAILPPARIDDAPDLIEQLCADRGRTAARIRAARSRWIYNVGSSGAAGAEYLHALAKEQEGHP